MGEWVFSFFLWVIKTRVLLLNKSLLRVVLVFDSVVESVWTWFNPGLMIDYFFKKNSV